MLALIAMGGGTCGSNEGKSDWTAPVNYDADAAGSGDGMDGSSGDVIGDSATALTSLTLSMGVLSPSFSSDVTNYTVEVGVGTQTITLTPTAEAGLSIWIERTRVPSGTKWQSPVLNFGANTLEISVTPRNGVGRAYTVTVVRGSKQQAYVKASNPQENDWFGYAVSLSGDGNTLAVGASGEDGGRSALDQSDDSAPDSGAVYVFTRSGSGWRQQAYIKASNADQGDGFGSSVSLSADGITLAVGAPSEDSNGTRVNSNTQPDNSASGAGAVYVFKQTGISWNQEAYIKASNTDQGDRFGGAVSLSADGDTLAVGARGESSYGVGVNKNTQSDNSAPSSGAVYVFIRSGSAATWTQQAYVKASNTGLGDSFGHAVSLSGDGDTLAVGSIGEASSGSGINSNTQSDNNAISSGAVYVFTRTGTAWNQQAYVKASNADADYVFGGAVSLSEDGSILAVGAHGEASSGTGVNSDTQLRNSLPNSGAVYTFARTGTEWIQQAYIKASSTGPNDFFGGAVSLAGDGRSLAVGAYDGGGDRPGVNSSTVYVFTREGTDWMQLTYVKASNTNILDRFGSTAVLSRDGNTLAVGAIGEDSNGSGVNSNTETDNSTRDSGAVYVFH